MKRFFLIPLLVGVVVYVITVLAARADLPDRILVKEPLTSSHMFAKDACECGLIELYTYDTLRNQEQNPHIYFHIYKRSPFLGKWGMYDWETVLIDPTNGYCGFFESGWYVVIGCASEDDFCTPPSVPADLRSWVAGQNCPCGEAVPDDTA